MFQRSALSRSCSRQLLSAELQQYRQVKQERTRVELHHRLFVIVPIVNRVSKVEREARHPDCVYAIQN